MASNNNKHNTPKCKHDSTNDQKDNDKIPSMNNLIIWNINKAIEKIPDLDLMSALKKAQETLDNGQGTLSAIVSQEADERHLSCALLAWQQMGHKHADSLYRFVVKYKDEELKQSKCHPTYYDPGPSYPAPPEHPPKHVSCCVSRGRGSIYHMEPTLSNIPSVQSSYDTIMGPVLKLPIRTKVCLRLDGVQNCGIQKTGQDIKSRIEKACCLESGCVERLMELDKHTKELRQRLGKLARREAQRIELLERAECAWRDLEMGYMRRHRICVEKEEDIARKSAKLIEDRNNSKEMCAKLVKVLKPRGEAAEKAREALKKLEADVCARACSRLNENELSSKEDAILADIQCKSDQQDRDLQFKEESARRKLTTLQNELESIRGLIFETERALKAELKGYKDQIQAVSKDLFAEDDSIEKMKKERDELLTEKAELIEDLEGCQKKCDSYMQKKVDELKAKREKLEKLKEQVLECQCKLPMDVGIEVKRTASLAALCYCSAEDRALKSCSCKSLRSRLLSDLFCDLFTGLQQELGDTAVRMPCQLLKCLEDNHNWDKPSHTRTNLRLYFVKLLVGELDIAIVNSIEKYHAQWVGASCADVARPIPDLGDPTTQGWEDRALAQKAHWMATAMAEEMFKSRVDEIMERAKDVVIQGGPPCHCAPPPDMPDPEMPNTALYSCLVDPTNVGWVSVENSKVNKIPPPSPPKTRKSIDPNKNVRTCLQRTQNEVLLLKSELEGLKRESIKKQDLKIMQKNIVRMVQRATGPDDEICKEKLTLKTETNNQPLTKKNCVSFKNKDRKKKSTNVNSPEKTRIRSQYAVNMCFCEPNIKKTMPKKSSKLSGVSNVSERNRSSNEILTQVALLAPEDGKTEEKKIEEEPSIKKTQNEIKLATCAISEKTCGSACACFNKIPSCSSLDNFLDLLNKWKYDLSELPVMSNAVLVNSESNNKTNLEEPPSKSKDISVLPCKSLTKNSSKKFTEPKKNSKNEKETKGFMPKCNYVIPAIQSEYMGAVNLDKSNENIKNTNQDKTNDSTVSKHTIKSANSCKCKLKTSELMSDKNKMKSEEYDVKQMNINEIIASQRKIKSEELNNEKKTEQEQFKVFKPKEWKVFKCIKKNSSNVQSERISQENPSTDEKLYKYKTKTIPFLISDENYDPQIQHVKNVHCCTKKSVFTSNTTLNNNINMLHKVSSDCNQIKLIGVTLADIKSEKKLKGAKQPNTQDYLYQPQQMNNPLDKINNAINSYPLNSMKKYDLFKNEKDHVSKLQQPSCHCNDKIDELKGLLGDINGKMRGTTKNKALDTDSFNKNSVVGAYESCICCKKAIDESNDLELNVFHLIEEHIKQKLENLEGPQVLNMKSDEANKLVARMFQKIKRTIADSTGNILCKCSEDNYDGSWQRAYNLLQEYLKIKINRVQCLCSPFEQSKGQTILPELTDKVCNLIEKDFERLKDICKSKINENSPSNKSSLNEEILFQIPEKDKNSKKAELEVYNELKNQKILEKKSLYYNIATNNISAQVKPILESKSCEVIKNADPQNYTVDTQMSNKDLSSLRKTCSVACNILDATKDTNSRSTQYFILIDKKTNDSVEPIPFGFDEITEHTYNNLEKSNENEETKQNLKVKDNNLKLPAIGCTIDCLCSSKDCECPKSKAIEYSAVVNKLWMDQAKNKRDYSYVMEKVNKNLEPVKTEDYLFFYTAPKTISQNVTTSDVDTSTHGVGLITLKDSELNVNKKTRNGGTNTELETIILGMEYGAEDWHGPENSLNILPPVECELKIQNDTYEQRKKKSVHFLHKSRSEILSSNILKRSDQNQLDCSCSKVPVCHVKMLVDDIENKLAHSECVCDTLSSQVCPIHTKKVTES